MAHDFNDLRDAIIKRASGRLSFLETIEEYSITPGMLAQAFTMNRKRVLRSAPPRQRPLLEQIVTDEEKRPGFFRMDYGFLEEQYLRVSGGKRKKPQEQFVKGTFFNPENVEDIVYIALKLDNPQLESGSRRDAVNTLKNLPKGLKKYLVGLGLGGLMNNAFEGAKKGSPLAVIEAFDRAYQRIRNDLYSLFELSRPLHLHKWGEQFKAPQSYWDNPKNVAETVYHMMTQHTPQKKVMSLLNSKTRKEVVQGISKLPKALDEYFVYGELSRITGKGNTVLQLLEAFDRGYQKVTGDKHSLFELSEEYHLHRWDYSLAVRRQTKLRDAAVHIIDEKNPELLSRDREQSIGAVRTLKEGPSHYFRSLGFDIMQRKEGSLALQVLRLINSYRMTRHKDSSLFDKNNHPYIRLGSDGRVTYLAA